MAAGDLSLAGAARVHTAVSAAEAATGLSFSVVISPGPGDPGDRADHMFRALGLAGAGAVLVLVLPDERAIEVRTSSGARERVSDDAARRAVAEMRIPILRDDFAEGIEAGLRVLSEPARTPA